MIFKNDVITSRSNPHVKWVAALQLKKIRDKEKAFFIEGEKLTFEAIKNDLPLTRVYVSEGKADKIIPVLMKLDKSPVLDACQVIILADGVFEKISTENAPQGVISVIKYLDFFDKLDIIYKENIIINADERAIILSSIRDPGNLGAVIRSAVAFGVEHIYLSSDCADVYNPKTVRGAMGSLFRVKITKVSDLCDFIEMIKKCGRRVYAAELRDGASSLSEIGLRQSDMFVIGNEGHGIPIEVSSSCTGSAFIPISANTESLNASVAAAVIMWEQSKL